MSQDHTNYLVLTKVGLHSVCVGVGAQPKNQEYRSLQCLVTLAPMAVAFCSTTRKPTTCSILITEPGTEHSEQHKPRYHLLLCAMPLSLLSLPGRRVDIQSSQLMEHLLSA